MIINAYECQSCGRKTVTLDRHGRTTVPPPERDHGHHGSTQCCKPGHVAWLKIKRVSITGRSELDFRYLKRFRCETTPHIIDLGIIDAEVEVLESAADEQVRVFREEILPRRADLYRSLAAE